ncbi:MAG: pyrroline-5-carboxylate reductase [Gammaproteobacteria bacterium]|nr:pyrroline-5-carboxylate reductase [Gammaproteobacteria bacterium]
MKQDVQIGFIGAGNMARSLIGGLLKRGHAPERLAATDPGADAREAVQALGVKTGADNAEVAGWADVLVLAVKPQVMAEVAADISAGVRQHSPLLISIAAGIPSTRLAAWLHAPGAAIVRAMPNTPALLGCGASGLFANAACTRNHRELAGDILAAVGTVEWVNSEGLIDAVTAVSGSGPAYFFLLMEMLGDIGAQLGLDAATARRLAQQTALGAARMATESDVDVAELRRRVTSPGGTTQAALESLEHARIRAIFAHALEAARDRARQLGGESKDD